MIFSIFDLKIWNFWWFFKISGKFLKNFRPSRITRRPQISSILIGKIFLNFKGILCNFWVFNRGYPKLKKSRFWTILNDFDIFDFWPKNLKILKIFQIFGQIFEKFSTFQNHQETSNLEYIGPKIFLLIFRHFCNFWISNRGYPKLKKSHL